MITKPMKTLELHYPMIQFLIIKNIVYTPQHLYKCDALKTSYYDCFDLPPTSFKLLERFLFLHLALEPQVVLSKPCSSRVIAALKYKFGSISSYH